MESRLVTMDMVPDIPAFATHRGGPSTYGGPLGRGTRRSTPTWCLVRLTAKSGLRVLVGKQSPGIRIEGSRPVPIIAAAQGGRAPSSARRRKCGPPLGVAHRGLPSNGYTVRHSGGKFGRWSFDDVQRKRHDNERVVARYADDDANRFESRFGGPVRGDQRQLAATCGATIASHGRWRQTTVSTGRFSGEKVPRTAVAVDLSRKTATVVREEMPEQCAGPTKSGIEAASGRRWPEADERLPATPGRHEDQVGPVSRSGRLADSAARNSDEHAGPADEACFAAVGGVAQREVATGQPSQEERPA